MSAPVEVDDSLDVETVRVALSALPFSAAEWRAIVDGSDEYAKYACLGLACELTGYVLDLIATEKLAERWRVPDPDGFAHRLIGLSCAEDHMIGNAIMRMSLAERVHADVGAMRREGLPV